MLAWKAHDTPVFDIAFSPDSQWLATSDDYATRLWEISTQTRLKHWERASLRRTVVISPDGKYVGTSDPAVWPVEGGAQLVQHIATSDSVAFSPNNNLFIAHGFSDYPLRRWSLPSGELLAGEWGPSQAEARPSGPIAFSPDGSTLAASFTATNELTGQFERVVILLDTKSGKDIGRLRQIKNDRQATRLMFSPDGNLLTGTCGPALIVWAVPLRKEIGRGHTGKKHFKGAAFTTDSRRLLTVSDDAYLRVWTAPIWEQTTIFKWNAGKLGCVAVSADGTLAAAGSSTGKVVVWDLE